MKQDVERSIGFHLWLSICAVVIAITSLTLLAYAWIAVSDSVAQARDQADQRIDVLVASAGRGGAATSQDQSEVARTLGLQSVDVFNSLGQIVASQRFDGGAAAAPVDMQSFAKAAGGTRVNDDVRFDGTKFEDASLSWFTVLRGGHFGQITYLPLSAISPNQTGAVRYVVTYDSDLTSTARDQLEHAAGAGLLIICLALIATWFMLNRSVSQRLVQYSDLALRMAEGEPVRMPASGRDELSSLGRALNGMADALEHQATVDALTGLYNLRHLSSNLEALIAQAEATQTPVSLIVGDLDNLKPINDTHGHQAGDRVLRAVGDAVREWTGTRNSCWRIGGDEFVVALPGADATDAMVKANDFRLRIASIAVQIGEATARVGISVGVATFPQDGETAGALIGIADRRMYMAKTMRIEGQKLAASTPAA